MLPVCVFVCCPTACPRGAAPRGADRTGHEDEQSNTYCTQSVRRNVLTCVIMDTSRSHIVKHLEGHGLEIELPPALWGFAACEFAAWPPSRRGVEVCALQRAGPAQSAQVHHTQEQGSGLEVATSRAPCARRRRFTGAPAVPKTASPLRRMVVEHASIVYNNTDKLDRPSCCCLRSSADARTAWPGFGELASASPIAPSLGSLDLLEDATAGLHWCLESPERTPVLLRVRANLCLRRGHRERSLRRQTGIAWSARTRCPVRAPETERATRACSPPNACPSCQRRRSRAPRCQRQPQRSRPSRRRTCRPPTTCARGRARR
jgi:hypothetical protein